MIYNIKSVKFNIRLIIFIYLLMSIFLFMSSVSVGGVLQWRPEPDSTSKRLPKSDPSRPMHFSTLLICPGSGCPNIIFAEGIIQPNSADRFKEFLTKDESHGDTICFNSVGGNLEGGIALGREIRKHGFNTCFLNYYTSENFEGVTTIYAENSVCLSACVYAFLGGVNREIEPNARLGVHQISGQKGNVGDSNTQFAIAEISAYLDEMGIDRRLLDIASSIPANEKVPSVSLNTSKKLKIENFGESDQNKWSIEIVDGLPLTYIKSEHPYNKKIQVTLAVARQNPTGTPLLIINAGYDSKHYENISEGLRDAFSRSELDDKTPLLEIKIDNHDAIEYKNINYEISNDSISTVVKVNNGLYNYMLSGKNIEIDINVANAWQEYNPSMNLTLKGFKETVGLILK